MVKNEIKVFARLKPESKKKNTVNYQIYRRPKETVEEDYLVLNLSDKSCNDYINNKPESWNFAFQQIFDRDIKQDEIFQNVAKPVVQSVLNGYNATIFAYGQTGSGKTFTITGNPERYEDRGVIPRTVQYLFETIEKNPDNIYSVEIAYLEIYNENGYDLLDPKHDVVTKLEDLPRVTIQEDENGVLHLKNLSFRTVDNEKDALALLFLGDTNRAISETPMNPESSRSHCIFTIAVTVKESGSENLSKAKMHLVDLAGSERVYKCCISGSILTEAKYINLSLHYLEQVIVCLGQPNVRHIPYRNSLLTAILRDSLGGNCLTTMLATLSLNTSNLEETISTCRFSQRVALIRNDVNLVFARNPEDENKFLKIEIERLKNQIAQLTEPPLTEELTAKEKDHLDNQVENFIKSDTAIDWEKDDRKFKYCLKILRQKLKTCNGEFIHVIKEPEKDLNYYRNLVIQRDREISALIEMLKRTGNNSLNESTKDKESFKINDFCDKTSPTTSIIAKKVRLKNLMAEARCIAELIKNGKVSIGGFKKRMSEPRLGSIEAKTLYEKLEMEQSKLANNLNRLKILKSEATVLKNDLISLQDDKSIPNANESLKFFANQIGTGSSKSFDNILEKFDSEQRSVTSNQDRIQSLTRSIDEVTGNTNRFEELSKLSSDYTKIEEQDVKSKKFSTKNKANDNVKNKCEDTEGKILKLIGVRNDNDERTITKPDSPNLSEKFVSVKVPNPGSKKVSEIDMNECEIKINGDNDSQESLSSENIGRGMKNSLVKKINEINQTILKSAINDLPRLEKVFNVSSSQIVSNNSKSKAISEDKFKEYKLARDFESVISDVTSSECNFNSSQSELIFAKEKSEKNLPSKFANDYLHKNEEIIDEEDDDNFIKSLPLTGDQEIDEEIIAFYRAKKSGGNY